MDVGKCIFCFVYKFLQNKKSGKKYLYRPTKSLQFAGLSKSQILKKLKKTKICMPIELIFVLFQDFLCSIDKKALLKKVQ